MKRISIACNSDNNYAQQVSVMLTSVIVNLSDNVACDIYILHNGIEKENQEKISYISSLRPNIKIIFILIDNTMFTGLLGKGHIPFSSYYRIALPIFLKKVSTVLYLDCDMIIESDVSLLWKNNLSTVSLYAAKLYDVDASNYYATTLHIPNTNGYFNSGVMLCNLERLRKKKSFLRIRTYLQNHIHEIIACDQDGLNATLWDDWKHLDSRWNQDTGVYLVKNFRYTTYSKKEFKATKEHPYIIHFTGADKPWFSGCIHPLSHRYFYYLEKTSFVGFHPEFNFLRWLANNIYFLGLKMVRCIPDWLFDFLFPMLQRLHRLLGIIIYDKKR